ENFEITAKLIIINAHNNQYKAYGDEDPVFSYSALPLPISGDEYTGGLSRESGEELGIYTITQGTLSLGANYNMSFNSADFEIKIKNLMIIVDENQSKEYGEPDPVLTFTPIPDIAPWDNFSGALEREPGELIGIYEISQGTLSLDDNDNYNIILFTGADFEITKITPIITWENPADINYGTALSATQLNATANISGSFAYNPDFNTILEIGDNQALNVEFTPTDNLYYNNTITTVYINVLLDIGVDEYHSNIKIYPNPAKDYVNIVQENTLYEYLKVYDITGKIVIELNLDDLITCLDISNLPSGVYFIALKPADSSPEVRAKLVKTDN
ncbi:MAG: MBG domain-containing protein, partial [Bacteroidales bacterium]|nr:MBG domain-containing protein [Bacteroidales bacterium]